MEFLKDNQTETHLLNNWLEENRLLPLMSKLRKQIDSFKLKDIQVVDYEKQSYDIRVFRFLFDVNSSTNIAHEVGIDVFIEDDSFDKNDTFWYRESNTARYSFDSNGIFTLSSIGKDELMNEVFNELLFTLFDIHFFDLWDEGHTLKPYIDALVIRYIEDTNAKQ